MLGLMQDWPLLCHRIIEHAARVHGQQEVVTRLPQRFLGHFPEALTEKLLRATGTLFPVNSNFAHPLFIATRLSRPEDAKTLWQRPRPEADQRPYVHTSTPRNSPQTTARGEVLRN